MKTNYTPTTEEVKGAYHKHRYYSDPRFRYSLGSLEEFDRWLAELIRKEREEAWVEGFDRGFYRGQVLPGDRDACEAGIENPYGPNGGE